MEEELEASRENVSYRPPYISIPICFHSQWNTGRPQLSPLWIISNMFAGLCSYCSYPSCRTRLIKDGRSKWDVTAICPKPQAIPSPVLLPGHLQDMCSYAQMCTFQLMTTAWNEPGPKKNIGTKETLHLHSWLI